MRPTRSTRPRAPEAADRGRHRLRPRLQLAEVARLDDDAALDRGEAQPRDQDLAGDDRGHHPAREDPLADQDDQRREHEHLVGDRVEERAERRRPLLAPREPPVDLVGRHRGDEERGRPVRVPVRSSR